MQHVELELQFILGLHDWWILHNTWNVDALDDLRWMMKGVNMKISRQFSPQYRDEATQSKTYFSGGLISPALHSECIGCNNNRYAAARGQTPARGPGPGPSVQRQSVRSCETAWTGTAASNSDEPGIHEWKQSTNSETDVLDPAATLSRLITLLTG